MNYNSTVNISDMIRSRCYVLLMAVMTAFTTARGQAPEAATLDVQEEIRPREGLPNFFAKVTSGATVTIGYFGGSITAAADGWRDQSMEWLHRRYPKAHFRQINAGVGGTGSDLGVFRLRHDVLEQHPDLVFVEFAVNDGGGNQQRIHQTMEGIVRQIWRDNPQTDICFVYTIAGNMLPVMLAGKLWPSMLAMEQIAQYYGIPSIQLGLEVLRLLKEGKLVFKGRPEDHPGKLVFTGDDVHPNTHTGHRLYTEALIRSMEQLGQIDHANKHSLKAPYTDGNWEGAQMLPASSLPRTGTWNELSAERDTVAAMLTSKFPSIIKSNVAGSALQLHFVGRMAGLYDVIGPGCGTYQVSIDGGPAKDYPRFDRHATYYRANYFFLPMTEEGEHRVTLEVSPKKLDKMQVLKQGDNKPGPPEQYTENACYTGWLLLLGNPVK